MACCKFFRNCSKCLRAEGRQYEREEGVEHTYHISQTSTEHYDVNYYEYVCRVYKSQMTLMMLMEERTGQEVQPNQGEWKNNSNMMAWWHLDGVFYHVLSTFYFIFLFHFPYMHLRSSSRSCTVCVCFFMVLPSTIRHIFYCWYFIIHDGHA